MTGSLDSYLTFELSSIVLCSVFNQVSVWRLNHLIFSVAMSDHFCDVFITHKPHAAILDVEFREELQYHHMHRMSKKFSNHNNFS